MATDQEMLAILLGEITNIYEKWSNLVIDLSKTDDPELTRLLFQEFFFGAHNLKAGFEFVGLTDYSAYIHKVEDLFQAARHGRLLITPPLKSLVVEITLHLGSIVDLIKKGSTSDPQLEVLRKKLEEFRFSQEEKIVDQENEIIAVASQFAPDEESQKKRPSSDQMVSVKSEKLDDLLNLIGDLTIRFQVFRHQFLQERLLKEKQQEKLESVLRDIGQLKEIALDLRMQPVRSLLSRLQMVALDAASKMQKTIEFQREGDDVLLDKSVVDRLTESLSHIIRNAIDHGIESSEERLSAKKSETSTVKVQVHENGPNVLIEISDDGRGIDPEFVYKKAIEKKLISSQQSLSEYEKVNLIFLPGFSTAEKVTVFSGRGIGMDIVKAMTKSLGGKIDIRSRVGEGTSFRISIPAQMSLVDALVVRVDQEKYGVAKQDLTQILDLTDYEVTNQDQRVVLKFQGEEVPLEWLNERILAKGHGAVVARELQSSVGLLVRGAKGYVAFCVDEVLQMQQVFVRPLPENMMDHEAFLGSTVFSDGEPGLMLNVSNLVRSIDDHHLSFS